MKKQASSVEFVQLGEERGFGNLFHIGWTGGEKLEMVLGQSVSRNTLQRHVGCWSFRRFHSRDLNC